jgi:hypothetical protein
MGLPIDCSVELALLGFKDDPPALDAARLLRMDEVIIALTLAYSHGEQAGVKEGYAKAFQLAHSCNRKRYQEVYKN